MPSKHMKNISENFKGRTYATYARAVTRAEEAAPYLPDDFVPVVVIMATPKGRFFPAFITPPGAERQAVIQLTHVEFCVVGY